MTPRACEREPLIIAAVRSGSWPDGLADHVAACSTCAETARLAQLFRSATSRSVSYQPPPAHVVWQKLQLQRRQLAVRRATQCMWLMCTVAALYAVVLVAWYLPGLWHRELATDLSPLSNGVVLAGVLTAVAAVFIGSCCFAFLGSRTTFPLRS